MHDAFLSYSRKDVDFARRLEDALERYRPPRELKVPQRSLDVFRDQADFTGADYFLSIERHLAESTKLIVLCSPRARVSSYVNDEIRCFARLRGAEHIVPVLLAGRPNNETTDEQEAERAFPRALCEVLQMPLAVSYVAFRAPVGFRTRRDRVDRGPFLDAWCTLLANLYGVSRTDLEQREKHRQARARRIAALLVGTVIVALVVSLLSWRRAANESIAARRQNATRIAVQADEKLPAAPERALELAIEAVETLRVHDDPLVASAVATLQKILLAFAGGQPALPWREGLGSTALDPSLRWAAASDEEGLLDFGPAGGASSQRLPPPAGLLADGEVWSPSPAKLAFTDDRLLVARAIEPAEGASSSQVVLWSWALGDEGPRGPAAFLGRFSAASRNHVQLLPSPDGRWVAITDGSHTACLQALAGDTRLQVEADESASLVLAFSPDSRRFYASCGSEVRRFALEDDAPAPDPGVTPAPVRTVHATELPPLPTELHDIACLSAFSGNPRDAGDEESPQDRLALMSANGEVKWWELGGSALESNTLPRVFAAYTEQLSVYGLSERDVRASLQWSPDGECLLASIAEASKAFGVAAIHGLRPGEDWQPLPHRHEGELYRTAVPETGRWAPVETRVPEHGFQVKVATDLGASAARWLSDHGRIAGAVTIGFEGTLWFWELRHIGKDRPHMERATRATCVVQVGDFLAIGRSDGRVRLDEMKPERESPPPRELAGHDAPVRALFAAPNGHRIASVDEAGAARVWELNHPVLRPKSDTQISADWSCLVLRPNDRPWMWPLAGEAPRVAPLFPAAFRGARSVVTAVDGSLAATLRIEADGPKPLVLALWQLTGPEPAAVALAERRCSPDELGLDAADWPSLFKLLPGRRLVGRSPSSLWIADFAAAGVPLARLGDETTSSGGLDASGHLDASDDGRWLAVASGTRRPSLASPRVDLVELGGPDGLGPREPRCLPLEGLSAVDMEAGQVTRAVCTFSPDGCWLVVNGDSLVDLETAAATGHAVCTPASGSGSWVFGRGRTPLCFHPHTSSYSANLKAFDPRAAASAQVQPLHVDEQLGALAWDDGGEWLGLGHGDGSVELLRLPAAALAASPVTTTSRDAPSEAGAAKGMKRDAADLPAASAHELLPPPAEASARGPIRNLFLFPELGWVVATTDHVLVWHRQPSGEWEQPAVFALSELRLQDSPQRVRFRPDGGMALIDGQLLDFDADALLAQGRALLSGRVR